MTRNEFLDGVNTWRELIEFCCDEDCDACEDICDEDQKDDEIEADLIEIVREEGWKTIYHWLDEIPTGFEYYRRDGMFDYVGMDERGDFQEYKDAALEWMDDRDCWDEEETEEPEEQFDEEVINEDGPSKDNEAFDEMEFLAVLGKAAR